MLLKNHYSVKLKKKYLKILYLSIAHHDTFVFLGMSKPGREVLVHCDLEGKILFENFFENPVDTLAMPSLKEAMVLDTRDNCISVFDLETYKLTNYPHKFIREESDLSDIETFPQTKLLCVKEIGQYNDDRFALTYYSYQLGGKEIARYDSKDKEWAHEYISRKGNDHSLMIWFRPRND
jgi:hypothetical protein